MADNTKNTFFSKLDFALFVVFFALIFGGAFGFSDVYDHMSNVDVQTYVKLSDFDFSGHPVRRYRVIVPLLAAGLRYLLSPVITAIEPHSFPGDFSMIFSFVLVNTALLAIFGLVIYKIVFSYTRHFWVAVLSVVAILSGRWALILAGTAMVDSLFLVSVALLLAGVRFQNWCLLLITIYIGPWAKESFVFFVPLLFFFSNNQKWIILHLILSAILVFGYRYLVDRSLGVSAVDSFRTDVAHFEMVGASLKRLFSFHGLYEIFSIAGVWNLFFIWGLTQRDVRKKIFHVFDSFWILFLVLILFQALLSTELARMFFMATPLVAVILGLVFSRLFVRIPVDNQFSP